MTSGRHGNHLDDPTEDDHGEATEIPWYKHAWGEIDARFTGRSEHDFEQGEGDGDRESSEDEA